MGNAVGLFADGDTFGAVFGLTSFIGAFDLNKKRYLAVGLLALHVADGVFGLLAGGMAAGRLANRVAYGGTLGIVTLPSTLGVALRFILFTWGLVACLILSAKLAFRANNAKIIALDCFIKLYIRLYSIDHSFV